MVHMGGVQTVTAANCPPAAFRQIRPAPARAAKLQFRFATWQGGPQDGVIGALAWTRDGELAAVRHRDGRVEWAVGIWNRPLVWRAANWPNSGSRAAGAAVAPWGARGIVFAEGRIVAWQAGANRAAGWAALPTGTFVRGLAVTSDRAFVTASPSSIWQIALHPPGLALTSVHLPSALGVPGALAALPAGRLAVVREVAPSGKALGTSVLVMSVRPPQGASVLRFPALHLVSFQYGLLAAGGDRSSGAWFWPGVGVPVHLAGLDGAGAWEDPVTASSDGMAWAAAAALGRIEGESVCGNGMAVQVPLPRDMVVTNLTSGKEQAVWLRPEVTALAARPGELAIALADGRLGLLRIRPSVCSAALGRRGRATFLSGHVRRIPNVKRVI